MKKITSALIMILGLVLINGLAMSADNRSHYSRSTPEINAYGREIVWTGEQVLSGNYLEASVDDMLKYSAFRLFVHDVTTGNITTMNVQWFDFKGTQLKSETVSADVSVPHTSFYANRAKFILHNPKTATNNVTANIVLPVR